MEEKKEEFEKLKKEHNKVALWVEYFSSKIHELENELKDVKADLEKSKEKEQILGRTILNLVNEKNGNEEMQKEKQEIEKAQ